MRHIGKLTAGLLAIAMAASMADCGGNNAGSTAPAPSTPAFSAAGTAKPLTSSRSKIMYIITPSRSNPFFKTGAGSASTKAKEPSYGVKVVSYDDDATKQAKLFDSAIADKAVTIIYGNANADTIATAVKKARDNSIPTFLIDREVDESDVAISQIVANNYQSAKAIVEEFAEAMGERGGYAELLSRESDTSAGMRSGAFHEVVDQYPDMKMVTQQTASWGQAEAYQKVETILQSNPNTKGIVYGNDTMAVSAAATVKAAGLKDTAIVGVDGSDETAEQIKSGNMVGTALRQATLIAKMGAERAGQCLRTGSTGKDEKQLVDCITITKDNVDKLKNSVYSG